jgi:hypothetical protein
MYNSSFTSNEHSEQTIENNFNRLNKIGQSDIRNLLTLQLLKYYDRVEKIYSDRLMDGGSIIGIKAISDSILDMIELRSYGKEKDEEYTIFEKRKKELDFRWEQTFKNFPKTYSESDFFDLTKINTAVKALDIIRDYNKLALRYAHRFGLIQDESAVFSQEVITLETPVVDKELKEKYEPVIEPVVGDSVEPV